jgi:rRNA biogenesis protein RRP5
MYQSA